MRLLMLGLLGLLGLTACAGAGRPASEAGDCAACHVDEAAAFARSRHARASQSAAFGALRARAGASGGLCDQCHRPDGPGLTCLTCHAAVGNRALSNGALVQDRAGAVLVGDERGLAAPHAVATSGFLRSSDLCATCHVVDGPGAFHEDLLTSWQHSPAGQRGVTCQGCHVSPVPGAEAARPVGRTGRPLADHRFVGLGAGADDGDALLGRGLELTVGSSGGEAHVSVVATTQGHRVLAGAAFVRGLRVAVEALDTSGAVLAGWEVRLDAQVDGGDPLVGAAVDLGLEPGGHVEGAWRLPAGARRVRACLERVEVQEALAGLLGLPPPGVRRSACVDGEVH
jgi:hypothetical protein